MEDIEIERTSETLHRTSSDDSENENAIGVMASPPLFSAASTATSVLPSLHVSAALLALQHPLMPDYLAAMASLMGPAPVASVRNPLTYKCAQCDARLHDVVAFVAHSHLHTSSVLPLVDAYPNFDSSMQYEQKEELVNVEI
ncbi:hypothetical protein Y032_0004g1813 [Ancylostoma ceylanicum]|nr:hypothetical protein Y032_0004g1813 [Ancylostoma ceylanicum]